MRNWRHAWDCWCLISCSCTLSWLSQDGSAEDKIVTFCRAASIFFSSKGGLSCVVGFVRALVLPKKEHHSLGVVFSQNSASGPFWKEKPELYIALVLKKSMKGACKGMTGCHGSQEWLWFCILVLVGTLSRCALLIYFISFGSPAWNKSAIPLCPFHNSGVIYRVMAG